MFGPLTCVILNNIIMLTKFTTIDGAIHKSVAVEIFSCHYHSLSTVSIYSRCVRFSIVIQNLTAKFSYHLFNIINWSTFILPMVVYQITILIILFL